MKAKSWAEAMLKVIQDAAVEEKVTLQDMAELARILDLHVQGCMEGE